MFSQDENQVSDASNTRRILTPVSDNFLNGSDGSTFGGKKRKRDGNTMEDLLKDSFVVKPYPSMGLSKPRALQPLILLPRINLPLSCINIVPTTHALPQSRLFETHVKILELEERMGSQPMVLIARLDDGRTLYAVEREDRGLYVLCQLGSWVNLQQLRAAAVVSKQDVPTASMKGGGPGALSLEAATIPLATPESSKYSKKKRLAIEAIQSMVKRPSTCLPTATPSSAGVPDEYSELQGEPSAKHPVPEDLATQRTAAEIFENIRTQYFEALYLSKASLAYFAKGPLSRARAAFHLDYDSTLDMNEHIAFLESLILSTTLIDKKYRDGIPGCVSLFDIHEQSADEANRAAEKTKKRRSNKKMKPNRTGLYPSEDTLIRKWWGAHDVEADSGGPNTSKEDIAKRRISQLRIRETQLQMIVILEVLALQPLASISEDVEGGLPNVPPSLGTNGKEQSAKAKKPDHLTMLIDVHIDRLCIWQSIALEAVKTPVNGMSNEGVVTASLSKNADNILRDFCVEVVAPFFSARLPDRCAIINRKLGGPVVVSPPKPKLSKSASFSVSASRPGAATKRPVPAKPRKSLQRILSNERDRRSESRGPNKAISLMRSATMPAVPGFKREASETPSLSNIPLAESQSLHANRGGVLNSKRFSQREVDLSSIAPETSAKARKQANIDAELKQAILALKKPNRELAGKSLVETAEKRSSSVSHSRKSKKPVRNPLFQGVQITATPKTIRRKDMSASFQGPTLPKIAADTDIIAIPPSSFPRIPQSLARPSHEGLSKNPLLSSVQATPTRKLGSTSSQRTNGLLVGERPDFGGCPPSSPSMQRRSGAQLSNTVPDSVVKHPSSSFAFYAIQDTPVKKIGVPLEHSHPSCNNKENGRAGEMGLKIGRPKTPALSQEESIYKSLGWDDTDDIDELA